MNHARHAQELLLHCMRGERDVSLAIMAEPYRIPPGNLQWAGASDGSIAVTWRRTRDPLPCTKVETGDGYVLVRWGEMLVMGVYLSPRQRITEVEERLDRMTRSIRAQEPAPVVIGGDFNAHSEMWGSAKNNARGRLVIDWAASLGVCLLNRGNESTCVRPHVLSLGESIVDLSWASPSASRMIRSWRVLVDVESLSDHVHIEIELETPRKTRHWDRAGAPRRWAVKKMDTDKMVAALLACTWPKREEEGEITLEQELADLDDKLRWSCDVAMPRQIPRPRKVAYWWSEEISDLRRLAIRARRRWTRARRRPGQEDEEARGMYREAKS